jgi:hypothetical protein
MSNILKANEMRLKKRGRIPNKKKVGAGLETARKRSPLGPLSPSSGSGSPPGRRHFSVADSAVSSRSNSQKQSKDLPVTGRPLSRSTSKRRLSDDLGLLDSDTKRPVPCDPSAEEKKDHKRDPNVKGARPYTYSTLSELNDQSEHWRVNFFALVLDRSGVYIKECPGPSLSTFKLIDPTLNPLSVIGGTPPCLEMTVFGGVKDHPKPYHLGSIIRCHRADVRRYKGAAQINLDIGIKASWALFHPKSSSVPSSHSHQSYTNVDNARLADLRAFGAKFFSQNITRFLSYGKTSNELDLLVLVLRVVSIPRKPTEVNYVKLKKMKACDGFRFYSFVYARNKFPKVPHSDVIRIRAVLQVKGKYELQDYSSFTALDKASKSVIALLVKIDNAKTDPKYKAKYDCYSPVHISSQVLDNRFKLLTLKDLFALRGEERHKERHRVRVSFVNTVPSDPKKWVVKSKSGNHYDIQFRVHDVGTSGVIVYVLFLNTACGDGEEFLPCPKPFNHALKKSLKRINCALLCADEQLELIVEACAAKDNELLFFIVSSRLLF